MAAFLGGIGDAAAGGVRRAAPAGRFRRRALGALIAGDLGRAVPARPRRRGGAGRAIRARPRSPACACSRPVGSVPGCCWCARRPRHRAAGPGRASAMGRRVVGRPLPPGSRRDPGSAGAIVRRAGRRRRRGCAGVSPAARRGPADAACGLAPEECTVSPCRILRYPDASTYARHVPLVFSPAAAGRRQRHSWAAVTRLGMHDGRRHPMFDASRLPVDCLLVGRCIRLTPKDGVRTTGRERLTPANSWSDP